MLKRREHRPRLAALQRRQRRAIQHRVSPPAAITLDRKTIHFIVEKLGIVCTRFKARELYAVLQILEQALTKANQP